MARDFIGTTDYGLWLPYHPSALRTFAERLVARQDAVILLSLDGERPNGLIALWTFENPMTGTLMASELVWWVDPKARGIGMRLLAKAEAWARARGADELHMVAPNERVAKFYGKVGYQAFEMTFRKPLKG